MAKLSTPYATALFRAALDQSVLAETSLALSEVNQTIESSPELQAVLKHPRVGLEKKKEIIRDCLGGQMNPILLNFFYVLVDNGRISQLDDISASFKELANAELGLVEVEVTSAQALSSAQEDLLKETLSRKTGKQIKLISKTDPKLIGGLVVAYSGRRMDGSLQTALDNFKQQLTGLN